MHFLRKGKFLQMICILLIILQKLVALHAEGVECEHRSKVCHSVIRGREGSISSPYYPLPYPDHTCCSWTFDISAGDILVLRIHDLDIEEDPSCKITPCCHHSWLSLPQRDGGTQKLCGHNGGHVLVTALPPKAIIKFYTSKVLKSGRGFNLSYSMEREASACVSWDNHTQCQQADVLCYNLSQRCNRRKECPSGIDERNCPLASDEYLCRDGDGFYTHEELCDGIPDCMDFSDEVNCGYCPKEMVACSPEHRHCFSMRQRCDGHLDCPCGEDEVNCSPNCPGKIACADGIGCITPGELLNDGHMCLAPLDIQGSHLLGVLSHNKFRCDNGQCISSSLWCDGKDNCGDNSDEQSCVKNSVITAAIMGALTCGLLLVVAVGCMCRLYSGRLHAAALASGASSGRAGVPPFWGVAVAAGSAGGGSGGRGPRGNRPSLPPPPPPSVPDALYGREPPPAYSVAVAEADFQQLTRLQPAASLQPVAGMVAVAAASEVPGLGLGMGMGPGQGRGGRRARRHSSSSRRAAVRVRHAVPVAAAAPSPVAAAPAFSATPASTLETSLADEDKCSDPAGEAGLGGGRAAPASSAGNSSASSSLSPSRDSITSSTSLLSYLSGADDDAPLLVIPPS